LCPESFRDRGEGFGYGLLAEKNYVDKYKENFVKSFGTWS